MKSGEMKQEETAKRTAADGSGAEKRIAADQTAAKPGEAEQAAEKPGTEGQAAAASEEETAAAEENAAASRRAPKKETPRKQQAQMMREHIKETALQLFERYGYANVSMAEIAEAAGCSVGNIYHYYKNKAELSIQVTDHVDEEYAKIAAEYEADHGRTAKAKLLDFVGRSLRISYQDRDLYHSFEHAMQFPGQRILRYKPERTWFRLLRALIRACKEEGSLSPDAAEDEVMEALIIIHRGTLMEFRIEEETFPLEETGRNLAAAYLDGLGAGASARMDSPVR